MKPEQASDSSSHLTGVGSDSGGGCGLLSHARPEPRSSESILPHSASAPATVAVAASLSLTHAFSGHLH